MNGYNVANLLHSFTPTSSACTAHAQHCSKSGVSACFGIARTFSPLCFTDSGFNSDSTQYPADCSVPKQVSSFNLKGSRRGSALICLLVIYRHDLYCSCSFCACLFRLVLWACYTCCFMCLCVVVYGGAAGPCSSTPGSLFKEKCIISGFMLAVMHAVSSIGERLSQTLLCLSHILLLC